ncbi:MAG: MFS transporter [Thermoplasmataceae archaeon]
MFEDLNSSPLRAFHFRNIIVNGVGVFSDSYNLYAFSLVYYTAAQFLGLDSVQKSLITASAFYGAALGAVLFGVVADRIGRKPMYGIDLALIFVGSIAQLFIYNFPTLFLSRFAMGFGIGGDYVMSPVIMAENANSRDRGKLMATTFSIMYLMGATMAAFVLQVTAPILPVSISWRVVLSFGSIPALLVIYYRRRIPETTRFLTRVRGQVPKETQDMTLSEQNRSGKDVITFKARLLTSLPVIITGSILWVLYDTYSTTFTVYGPITIASALGLTPITFTYAAVFMAGLPGTILSLILIDRIGRKKLVAIGYAGVFASLLLFAILLIHPSFFGLYGSMLVPGLVGVAAGLGFTFYLFNYLFSALGPATVIGGTIIVPELLPTKVRASGQGINVSIDRLANALVITAFTTLIAFVGLGYIVLIYAMIAIGSSILMFRAVPEAKGKTLEELASESPV